MARKVNTPFPSWTTPAKVVRVIDGDTIEVEVSRRFQIRFLDCWCPESRRDPRVPADERDAQKALGIAAKENLQDILSRTDGDVLVQIPTHGEDFATLQTMGRLLGYVFLPGNSKSLSEIQVAGGFATTEKLENLKR